jgi:hypothetical protein
MTIWEKISFDNIKKRMEAIWANDYYERFGFSVVGPENPSVWNQSVLERPDKPNLLESFYTDPRWMHERALYEVKNRYYLGDAFPCLFPFFGTAGYVRYFPIDHIYKKETIWFFPKIYSLVNYELKFDPQNEEFQREWRCMESLASLSNGQYMVAQPDNCGSVDMLSELIGSDTLMMEMVTDPDQIKQRVDEAVDVLINSEDIFIETVKSTCFGGTAHGWMNLWSPGKMMQLQCDLSVMLSPEMFERFVLPELEKTTSWLDNSVYHLDGQEQERHLEMLLSIKKLNMIQWQPVAGQPPITSFIPVLKRIQKAGKGLLLRCRPHEIEQIVNELSPKGVMIVCFDRSLKKSDAEDLLRIVEKASKKH